MTTKTRALIGTIIPLEEAAYDASTGNLTLTVITPGLNKSKERFYPADVLKRDYRIFEGAKMFANHQSDKESKDRPEGDVNKWVAQITKVWPESDGRIKATAAVIDPPFKAKLEELGKKNLLQEMGVSIRAIGEAVKGEIQGAKTNIVEALLRARSVDFVTYAGAGGMIEAIEADQGSEQDVDLVSEAELRQRRPDLIELIESKSGEKSMSEQTLEQKLIEAQTALAAEKTRADAAEVKATKLQETSDTQVESIKTLTTKIEESETAAKKVAAAAELKTMLEASQLAKLPKEIAAMAFKRVAAQFAEALTNDGMKEAVSAEEAYVKSMNGPARVTKMGEQDNATIERKTNLKESFIKHGMSEQEATIAAAGRR